MTLTLAGPGTRSYAFVIDWHIRVLLALAWILLGLLLALLVSNDPAATFVSRPFALVVILPALGIYFLYHPVLEIAMRGRTPGKRMAGTRIVTRAGAIPEAGALLMRNVLRIIDSLPAFYVIGLATCLFTAQRVRLGDMAAGTVLILDETPSMRGLNRRGAALERDRLQRGRLQPEAIALIEDLLERWPELDQNRRGELARTVLSRLEAGADPAELATRNEQALHARLQSLLAQSGT